MLLIPTICSSEESKCQQISILCFSPFDTQEGHVKRNHTIAEYRKKNYCWSCSISLNLNIHVISCPDIFHICTFLVGICNLVLLFVTNTISPNLILLQCFLGFLPFQQFHSNRETHYQLYVRWISQQRICLDLCDSIYRFFHKILFLKVQEYQDC